VTLLLLAAAATSLGATAILYRSSVWARQNPYRYDGRHLDLVSGHSPRRRDLADAYHWLRARTPATAFVLERPVHGNDVLIPAIAERRVVAVLLWHHNAKIPHQLRLQRRANAISTGLASCQVSQRQLDSLFRVPAPWPAELFAVAPIRDAETASLCRAGLDPRITIAHQNRSYRVFSIRR
jgi:hypothetical protein